LDAPLAVWNQPGGEVPTAPTASGAPNPLCERTPRPPETPADLEVAAAGWKLVGSFEGGWGILAVTGTADFDGMCRPVDYQVFVFYNGQFAGTIAPEPMTSRTSGAGTLSRISSGQLFASFVRYAETDPLCCPSRPSVLVEYRIDQPDGSPVLVPSRVFSGT